jgi:hypothetical protein
MANPFKKLEDNNQSDWTSNPELNPAAKSATSVQGDTSWRDAKIIENTEDKEKREKTSEKAEQKEQPVNLEK